MATSGSFNTNAINKGDTVGNRYLTFSWSVKEQDIATNKTIINWSLKGAGGNVNYYYKAGNFKVTIDGDTVYSSSTRIELYGNTTVASGTKTIYHNSDGARDFIATAEAGIYDVAVNSEGDEIWSLPKIARYGTSNQSLNSKTETTIKMNWSSDSTVDYIWYSKDNGSNWTGVDVTDGKSGNYTISGLSANTTYNIKTRIRRKDSQLTTDSSALSVTTYDYPHCTESPNFIIGNSVTMKIYNPLSRTITLTMIGANGTSKTTSSFTGASLSGFSNDEWKNFWYSTIPNAKSGTYQVSVTYGSVVRTRNNKNTYSIVEKDCLPTFTTFTYLDSNSAVKTVTRNGKIIVKGKSTLRVTITSGNKMTAKNSATPTRYNVSIDTKSQNVDYSTSTLNIDVGAISSSGTKRVSVRAYDSRGLSTLVYQDITVYDYNEPVINASVTRLNNYEAQSTLSVSGTYSRLTIDGEDKNTITEVGYRYRETGGTWSDEVMLTATLNNGKFTCNDVPLTLDNQKSFEFEIWAIDKLKSSPTVTAKVDVGQAVFFISSNKKMCYVNGLEVSTRQNYTLNGDAVNTNIYERGRPMYKRCFNGTLSANDKETRIALPDNAVLRNFYGNIYSGSIFVPLNYANPSATVYTYFDVINRDIVIISSSNFWHCEYVVYAEYTIGEKEVIMDNTVIIALISFAGTLLGTFGGIITSNKLTTYRIEQLEKRVEKHNNVIERVYELEKEKAVFEEDLKVVNHRVADLEHFHK